MDANDYLDDDGAEPAPRAPRSRKGVIALSVSALVLCTAGGAVGGLAIGDALHHGSGSDNAGANAGGANGYWFPGAPPNGGGYGGLGLPGPGSTFPGDGTRQSGNSETTTTATAKQLIGLVRIQSTDGYAGGAAVGTGLILSSDGEVVTNHHVIAGATKIVVTVMSTGQQYQATLVGSDATDDIAVLRLSGASGLSAVRTDTSSATVGESVTAVGDAQGASTFTASPGKVTALDQTISPSDGNRSEKLTGIIQYAAAVMSGDSGGATYNASQDVIGMTTAASSGGTQTNGFAIPIAKVLRVAADLSHHASDAKYTYGLPAFLGVAVNQSAVVEQAFPGTGAASIGLEPGDRIVAVNGIGISTASQLQTATRKHQAGQTISLTWTTPSGQRHTANVRLIAGPAA
ncbi:MAG: trypsin-like peptidase domain-containing protein [Marmoricola sp.]